jgi:hypothetical protein
MEEMCQMGKKTLYLVDVTGYISFVKRRVCGEVLRYLYGMVWG